MAYCRSQGSHGAVGTPSVPPFSRLLMGQAYLSTCFHVFFLKLSLSVHFCLEGSHGLRIHHGQVTCLASDVRSTMRQIECHMGSEG